MATLDKEIEILMLKGQKGDTGRSIESIIKTSSSGDIDTYTITYTDGTTTTFEIENGVSSQDLQNALSPITSDITDLQNDKLNNSWRGDEVYENNSILNDARGIEFILNGNEQYAEALHQPHQIKFNVESYNHGDNENTYQTNIIVSDRDININRDLGDGNENVSLFDLANNHLYQHNITLIESNVKCYLTILNNNSTPFDLSSLRDYMPDNLIPITASGYYLNNGVRYAIIEIYKMFPTGFGFYCAGINTTISNGTVNDNVIQVF